MTQEHEVLSAIFNQTLTQINDAKQAGLLPNIRTSVLPYIMTLAEDVLGPVLDPEDPNYNEQLFAISAAFGWTIKRFMSIERFIDNMHSEKMRLSDRLLEDMLAREHVTKEDVDKGWDKLTARPTAGVG